MLIELGTNPEAGTELVPCRTIRAFEQEVFASGAATSAGLMEIAGAAVVAAIEQAWPELAPGGGRFPGSAVVLCGPGLNGGDGYIVARLLHEKGWSVDVIGLGDPARQPPEAAAARQRLIEAGGKVDDAPDPEGEFPGHMIGTSYDVAVDAILGSGARHPMPQGWYGNLYDFAENSDHLVCVDGHSALDLDSGAADSAEPAAELTVTFHRARPGHVLGQGPLLSGRVMVADLGLHNEWMRFSGPGSRRFNQYPLLWTRHLPPSAPALAKDAGQHKYDHGHALVLSGGASHAGAARLAARAALRVGAGLVTLGLPEGGVTPALPDALMRRVIAGPDDLTAALEDERIRALCLGPGLGLKRARALVEAALHHPRARHGLRLVLDADALTAFADDPQALFDLTRHREVVLTPHGGEFARLLPKSVDASRSLIGTIQEAARGVGCVLLHKGAATVVADGSGPPRVIGAWDVPWLATAGTGDVLAGIITGLLARGFPPIEAAATGAWLHAAAARRFGPGLIADDLPDQLPGVFRDLGL
ncbi:MULTISPECIES: NAD(P)H-hydrate dehydratase [unclassified Paracoccus (in: a-proteobacteria)]|uniref:NAD(P)H-hydrate dehydratase n=1 Tax=unclassified Paracoccus (in: a-proteobacteria) TaxID=2688777 RepID=UPI0016000BD5|nr:MULTISPECIES: NAD(P)H-hydrate dehydratase [unclassified Paracoccus (in: a-proteobacteria)]MBB1490455.1 NAD(P)H-hydrate dehydratase [Paracoccus sp. MC1854]MBB1497298.1 NAD(P)H-hydrate dehydratase [Paracoccus sp. MC1862]QQO44736.1 NAD(P)H-hydrate dehydratase [Paracoccus sp. MC1862]